MRPNIITLILVLLPKDVFDRIKDSEIMLEYAKRRQKIFKLRLNQIK